MSESEEGPYWSEPVPGHPGLYTVKGTKKPGDKVRSIAEIQDFLFGLVDKEKNDSTERSDTEPLLDA